MTCTGDFTEKENARAPLGGQSRAVKRSGAEGIERGTRTETSIIERSLSKPFAPERPPRWRKLSLAKLAL